MLKIMIPFVLVCAIIGATLGARWHSRRRGDATPDLHRHPERLDQMLDPTDDA